MTMTKIKKMLLLIGAFQLAALTLLFISKEAFLNFEIAMLSTAMITAGSLYAYRNMIRSRSEMAEVDDGKDIIDMMDDPYDLYEEERQEEIQDIKTMINEEKARQKQAIFKNTVQNASALVSVYRLLPYAFLIFGFMTLQNNQILQLIPYMTGLAFGILLGFFSAKKLFIL